MPTELSIGSRTPVGSSSQTATGAPAADTVAASSLSGRVKPDRACFPRLRLLARLGALVEAVKRCFSPAPSGLPRLPTLQRAQGELATRLGSLCEEIAAPAATADRIEQALVSAGLAARALQAAGGATHAVLEGFGKTLEQQETTSLRKLALAFRGTAVGAAQTALQPKWQRDAQEILPQTPGEAQPARSEAERLLMQIQLAVNAELARRIDLTVKDTLDVVLGGLSAGASPARVAAQLHATFDSAAPLIKLGVLHPGRQTQAAVDQVVLARLGELGEHDRAALLAHMRTGDLLRLQRAGASAPQALQAAVSAVQQEIDERPERLAATFGRQAESFINEYSSRQQVDGNAFVRDVSALGATLNALAEHGRTHALGHWSASLQSGMSTLKGRVDLLIESILGARPYRAAWNELSGGQVSALSATINALGGRTVARSVLGSQQQAHLTAQRDACRQRLAAVCDALAAGDDDPGALLHGLARLEQASQALKSTVTAYHSTDYRVGEAARQAEIALFAEGLQALSGEAQSALAAALREPRNQALISALQVGAGLALDTHETAVAERLSNMARLLEQIAAQVEERAAGASGETQAPRSASSPGAQPPALIYLTAEARRAFRELYGLDLPAQGPSALRAGRLTPLQMQKMAAILESPPSKSESKLVPVGRYEVGEGFRNDARRRLAYRVPAPAFAASAASQSSAPTSEMSRPLSRTEAAETAPAGVPMIDTRDWPDDDAQVDARIAAGYEHLIELCGGNEEQARALTLLAYQPIMAGFFAACMDEDSPLQLPDGTPGSLDQNAAGGALKRTEISFSMGESGRPRMEVDYRIEGRAMFLAPDGSQTYLSPDSYLRAHFRVELRDNGTPVLLEAPSYQFALRPDAFQGHDLA